MYTCWPRSALFLTAIEVVVVINWRYRVAQALDANGVFFVSDCVGKCFDYSGH